MTQVVFSHPFNDWFGVPTSKKCVYIHVYAGSRNFLRWVCPLSATGLGGSKAAELTMDPGYGPNLVPPSQKKKQLKRKRRTIWCMLKKEGGNGGWGGEHMLVLLYVLGLGCVEGVDGTCRKSWLGVSRFEVAYINEMPKMNRQWPLQCSAVATLGRGCAGPFARHEKLWPATVAALATDRSFKSGCGCDSLESAGTKEAYSKNGPKCSAGGPPKNAPEDRTNQMSFSKLVHRWPSHLSALSKYTFGRSNLQGLCTSSVIALFVTILHKPQPGQALEVKECLEKGLASFIRTLAATCRKIPVAHSWQQYVLSTFAPFN